MAEKDNIIKFYSLCEMFTSEFISALAVEKEKNNTKEKYLNCGSLENRILNNPTLNYSGKIVTYKAIHIYKKCQFTWVEP